MGKLKKAIMRKLNKNKGMTMVELIVTFALLGLFMVAATQLISYSSGIYYAARGSIYGMQVSTMISNKIVGSIEGALNSKNPTVTENAETGVSEISFTDETGSEITISATPEDSQESVANAPLYMNIHYEEVTSGPVAYDAVDWRFDKKAYMGYQVKSLTFSDPNSGSVDSYPDNVVKMTLVLKSDRYGEYTSTYYIKCVNVDKIVYES